MLRARTVEEAVRYLSAKGKKGSDISKNKPQETHSSRASDTLNTLMNQEIASSLKSLNNSLNKVLDRQTSLENRFIQLEDFQSTKNIQNTKNDAYFGKRRENFTPKQDPHPDSERKPSYNRTQRSITQDDQIENMSNSLVSGFSVSLGESNSYTANTFNSYATTNEATIEDEEDEMNVSQYLASMKRGREEMTQSSQYSMRTQKAAKKAIYSTPHNEKDEDDTVFSTQNPSSSGRAKLVKSLYLQRGLVAAEDTGTFRSAGDQKNTTARNAFENQNTYDKIGSAYGKPDTHAAVHADEEEADNIFFQ
jgi:hypothetical protein